jgi:Protein of unknown function (DUF1329)
MKTSTEAALAAAFSVTLLGAACTAHAAVTPEEAARLGKDLTAIGADRAGSPDGGIPAYEGGEAPLAGWSFGKTRSSYSRYKDEKPLFSIDSTNVDSHTEHLTEAQVAAFKAAPGYRMDVYPSHRACSIDPTYAERSRQNATEAQIGTDGWTLKHARTAGVPFPIPKSGVEAMYNSRMRPQGIGYRVEGGMTMISPIPGHKEFSTYLWNLVTYVAAQRPDRESTESAGGIEFYLHYTYREPASLKGQALIALSFANKAAEQYFYFPGQRRVRRLPNAEFDAPVVGYENQYLNDEQFLLWSTLDRFEYKLLGKKDIFIQYNSLKMYDFDSAAEQVYGKSFINPDYRRYELHRVWVVDARLKPGSNHLVPHRVYYLDEDSWAIAVVTEYDQKGRVWKLLESALIPIWELGGSCGYAAYTIWDLLGGRYVSDFSMIGTHRDIKWVKATDPEAGEVEFKEDFYTPETLRAISER